MRLITRILSWGDDASDPHMELVCKQFHWFKSLSRVVKFLKLEFTRRPHAYGRQVCCERQFVSWKLRILTAFLHNNSAGYVNQLWIQGDLSL